jgi:hypothetical protein
MLVAHAIEKTYRLSRRFEMRQKAKTEPTECFFCEYKSLRKDTLKKHLIRKHPVYMGKTRRGKNFTFLTHLLFSQGIRLFCDACDYFAATRSILAFHLESHNPPSRHVECCLCTTATWGPLHLREHVRKQHLKEIKRCFA